MQYTVLLFTICFLLRLPQQARRSRGQTTGYTKPSRTTNRHQPVKVMHWNAEGVHNKQTDLQHVLHENNITICCIQETHLQPKTPLTSEDTSVFDPTELAGTKEGSSPWSETASMLFRPQHTWMTPSSPNDKALSLNAQQSFTELGI